MSEECLYQQHRTFDYGYNILPCGVGETVTTLPKLTLCFSNVTLKSGVEGSTSNYRFAKVGKYVVSGDTSGLEGIEDGEIKAFKAGYIYNITGLTVDDEDMGETPDGGKDATLTATVTVTPWKLVNGTVEWQ